jgi:hypothetical protein
LEKSRRPARVRRSRTVSEWPATFILACTAALCGAAGLASADIIDLTSGVGSSGSVNGALFQFGNDNGGTGLINPFVRLQANGTEEGYNTSASGVPFDEKPGSWTHDVMLNQIPIITIEGVDYFEFLLDINESSGGGNQFLSLDAIQIYTSAIGSQNTTNVASLGVLRYNLDAGTDSHIRLNANNTSGSGQADMTAYIPISIFAGAGATDFVYFYSFFGGLGTISGQRWTSSGGFEEWAVEINENSRFIPTPGTLALLGLGLIIARSNRRRR